MYLLLTDATTESTLSVLHRYIPLASRSPSEAGKIMHTICITMEIHIIIYHLALQEKKSTIKKYLQEIQTSADATDDDGVLDHTIAKLLPVLTSLLAHVTPMGEVHNAKTVLTLFTTTDTIAPAEKNKAQFRFHKVKTAGRIKNKFPLK